MLVFNSVRYIGSHEKGYAKDTPKNVTRKKTSHGSFTSHITVFSESVIIKYAISMQLVATHQLLLSHVKKISTHCQVLVQDQLYQN